MGKRFLLRCVLILLILVIGGFMVLFLYHTGVTQNVDSYIYELPFEKGEGHRVVQGYGGLFSHSHIAALDFEMPVGTPVHAARAGFVYSYRDDSDEGGLSEAYKDKANYIIIKHDDGSYGCYWHLKKNGVLTKKGYVKAGQQIGFSGKTGMVVQAHLHFSVKKRLNYEMNSFVKTRFRTDKGIVLPVSWNVYRKPAR